MNIYFERELALSVATEQITCGLRNDGSSVRPICHLVSIMPDIGGKCKTSKQAGSGIGRLERGYMQDYQEFLTSKRAVAPSSGIDVSQESLHEKLFPFQRALVQWALRKGRAAIFADCGLGKTLVQLEWARLTGQRTLILAPLAVASQTIEEGKKIGVEVHYTRSGDDLINGINITNYEMLEHFDPTDFGAVVLDESSILKSYMGKTKRALVEAFAAMPYRLCCTATPAPNDVMEIGNHAEFLGIMPSSEMLMRWFINDTMQSGHYRLKGHAERDFWQWVASWAISLRKPSDLGYSDDGFVLPELVIQHRYVETDITVGAEEGQLFRAPAMSATNLHKEMRLTAADRAQAVAEMVNGNGEMDFVEARVYLTSLGYQLEPTPQAYRAEEAGKVLWSVTTPQNPNGFEVWTSIEIKQHAIQLKKKETWVCWCNTNYEADELKARIPDAIEVRGSDSIAEKERKLTLFSTGQARIIIAKPSQCGYGLNWQHCHRAVFVGLSYSFEDVYQAIRRVYRFGQRYPVEITIIAAETESALVTTLERKTRAHLTMSAAMNATTARLALEENRQLVRHETFSSEQGQSWMLYHGDCVTVTQSLPSDSIHFSIFSPPFSSLYIYSDAIEDMGNSADDDEFFQHFDFLIPELLRITKPGRLCAVHCKDLVNYKGRDGAAGLRDFSGEIIRHFSAAGWQYHSKVVIWKDPVIEMQRTKAHGLLYKQLRADSTYSRQGMPEYLLVFRKWPRDEQEEAEIVPVTHTKDDFPLDIWQRYASPVWFDIRQTRVLNVEQARESQDEKHICPLQLDVIERAVQLWTNPGEVVFSPFAGIGSEGYEALRLDRKFVGVELKESYFQVARRNLEKIVAQKTQATLFDALEESEVVA